MIVLNDRWRSPPESLILSAGEAHVWRARLDLPASRIQAFEQTLAAGERARASRFRLPEDRARFVAARGTLRAMLGRYLSREPHTLQFIYNEYGKPAIACTSGSDLLAFNLAHSHNMALYAVTRSGEIGIDIEQVQPGIAYEHLAGRFFSPSEASMLRAVPARQQQEIFFRCWTRKEAYIKARGMGLSLSLSQFDVSVTPGEPAALLEIREEGQDASRWSLYDLAPGPGYAAALAVKGHLASLICWQWPE
jgi:4'-phosphopantetheinyl transferase